MAVQGHGVGRSGPTVRSGMRALGDTGRSDTTQGWSTSIAAAEASIPSAVMAKRSCLLSIWPVFALSTIMKQSLIHWRSFAAHSLAPWHGCGMGDGCSVGVAMRCVFHTGACEGREE